MEDSYLPGYELFWTMYRDINADYMDLKWIVGLLLCWIPGKFDHDLIVLPHWT